MAVGCVILYQIINFETSDIRPTRFKPYQVMYNCFLTLFLSPEYKSVTQPL